MTQRKSSILITTVIAFGTLVQPALSQNAAEIGKGFAENQASIYRSLTANKLGKNYIKALPNWTQSAKGWQDNVVAVKPETKELNIQWEQALPAADAFMRDAIINAKPVPSFKFVDPLTIQNYLNKTPFDGNRFINPVPLPLVLDDHLMSAYQSGNKRFFKNGNISIEIPNSKFSEYQRETMQLWLANRAIKLKPDRTIQATGGRNEDLPRLGTFENTNEGMIIGDCPQPCTAEQKAKPQRRLQIAALMGQGDVPFCTATAISSKWLLTAAHCVCRNDGSIAIPDSILFGSKTQASARNYSTILKPSNKVELFDRDFCRKRILWKSAPKPKPAYPANDLALIELYTKIIPASGFKFASVANGTIPSSVSFTEIAGFGTQLGARAGSKAWASMSLGVEACKKKNDEPRVKNCRPESEIVAFDFAKIADSCHGDSGGPLYFRSQAGHLIISAIVSRGIKESCGPGGIYVTVHREEVRDWINRFVKGVHFTAFEGFLPAFDMVLGQSISNTNSE